MADEIRTTSHTGGQKGVKEARFDLIPAGPLTELAELYGFGARKYSDRNWEKGFEWSKSFAALNRHLWLFWSGEEFDDETGKSHLSSVVFHAFALRQFMDQNREFDDRPKIGAKNNVDDFGWEEIDVTPSNVRHLGMSEMTGIPSEYLNALAKDHFDKHGYWPKMVFRKGDLDEGTQASSGEGG